MKRKRKRKFAVRNLVMILIEIVIIVLLFTHTHTWISEIQIDKTTKKPPSSRGKLKVCMASILIFIILGYLSDIYIFFFCLTTW